MWHQIWGFNMSKSVTKIINDNYLTLPTATWPCQVKEYKIVSEPSLLTGWLAVLSTSFPISGPQTGQNPATRLRLSLKDGSCNSRFRPVTVIFCGFFTIFRIKTKSDALHSGGCF